MLNRETIYNMAEHVFSACAAGSVRVEAPVRRWVELEVKSRMPEKLRFAWIGPNTFGKERGSATDDELNAVYELAAELATLLNEANEGRTTG